MREARAFLGGVATCQGGAWLAAAIMAAIVSFSLLRIPVQLTDSLIPMLQVQGESPAEVFRQNVRAADQGSGFLRPIRLLQIGVLLDLAGEHYFLAFKGFHVVLVALLFALMVSVARVRTKRDLAAFMFALTVLTGMHTFLGSVWESYPINHFLEISVLSVATLAMSRSGGGWWIDVLTAVLFIGAVLTLESGVLVWVVAVAARLVGWRGVSWKGLVVMSALLVLYFYFRLDYLQVGMPTLAERSTGFGFERLDPQEVIARFGDNPLPFYLYNVVSATIGLLLSEPRSATWEMTARVMRDGLAPVAIVSFISALSATGLIVWLGVTRVRVWVARRFDDDDRFVLVFGVVLLANATLSYVYVKDEIMGTAGVFYALAVFAAARCLLRSFNQMSRSRLATAALTMFLLVASSTWAVRAVGLHYNLFYMGFTVRNDWAGVNTWLEEQQASPSTPEGRRLVALLQQDAIQSRVLNPYFMPRWGEAWFR
jgi:hypothetical protein